MDSYDDNGSYGNPRYNAFSLALSKISMNQMSNLSITDFKHIFGSSNTIDKEKGKGDGSQGRKRQDTKNAKYRYSIKNNKPIRPFIVEVDASPGGEARLQ